MKNLIKILVLFVGLLLSTNSYSQFTAYRANDNLGVPDCASASSGWEIWAGISAASIADAVMYQEKITNWNLQPYAAGWFGDTQGELYYYDGAYWLLTPDLSCGSGGGCASLPYTQDFETGSTQLNGSNGSQASVDIDGYGANNSIFGLHLQGNTSTSWSSQYSTGELAFTNSPSHVASASRVICTSPAPALTLTFDIKQTYSFNSNYSWFRLTVNGIPVMDDQGNTYYNASTYGGLFKTLTYDLSAYTNTSFTVSWEGCMKYHNQYYNDGDNIFIDNISLAESLGGSPPNIPGDIIGFTLPNAGGTETYTIDAVQGATSYTWSFPVGWTINSGQGSTSVNVTTNSTDGDVGVTADNSYGNSSMRTLAITTIESVTSFPASVNFESETNHSTTASSTGFTFVSTGWRNVEGDHGDWRAYSGTTPSINTGPTGASKFLYVESSSPMSPNRTFYLWSPPYDLSGTSYPLLTFQYHMYSSTSDMGSLSIQISTDHGVTWSNDINFMASGPVSGTMGSEWRQGVIDLGSYSSIIMLRFIAITGSGWASDICLDEVSVVDIASSTVTISEDVSLTNGNYNNANSTLELSGTTAVTVTTNGYEINNLNISNTGGVTIGDNMNINGNLLVTDGTLNCGSYNIALGGNLTISSGATFTSGTSVFTFDGESTQTITTDGNPLYRLTINNSTSETAIALSGDLTIEDRLTLTNGIITTGVDKVVMNANLGVSLSGGSSTCFINGNFRRNITANTNTYTLPIGKGNSSSDYYPADLSNNNLTGISYIDASVASINESGNDIDDNISTSQDGDAIIDIKEDAIWVIRPNTEPSGGNFGVNLYLGEMTGLQNNKFYIVKRPITSTNYADWDTYDSSTIIPVEDAAGRTLTSGFASKRGFTAFSDFGVGDGGGSALPIELLSFTAAISGDRVILTWTTATEINNDYFTVEKTLDGIAFEEVIEMPGSGNSFEPLTYIAYDEAPLPGVSYYRLKQTDYDGMFEYSSLVELDNVYISDITLYNVTHTDNTKIILSYQMKNNIKYDLYVYDITGKIVKHDIIYSESGHNQYELDIRNYPAGTYFITLRNQNEVYSDRFVVK